MSVCRNWHSFKRGLVKQALVNMRRNTSQVMIFSSLQEFLRNNTDFNGSLTLGFRFTRLRDNCSIPDIAYNMLLRAQGYNIFISLSADTPL